MRRISFGDDNRFVQGDALREAVAFDVRDEGREGDFVFLDDGEIFTLNYSQIGWRPGPPPGELWYVERLAHDGRQARFWARVPSGEHVVAIVTAVQRTAPNDIVRFMAPRDAGSEQLGPLLSLGATRI